MEIPHFVTNITRIQMSEKCFNTVIDVALAINIQTQFRNKNFK